MELHPSWKELDDIINLAKRIEDEVQALSILAEDAVSLMTQAFLTRQIEYASSVKLLSQEGLVAAAALVARTMLEGVALLAWVLVHSDDKDDPSQEAVKRALRWYDYRWVEALEEARIMKASGFPIPTERVEEVSRNVEAYADSFDKRPKNLLNGWKRDDNGAPVTNLRAARRKIKV